MKNVKERHHSVETSTFKSMFLKCPKGIALWIFKVNCKFDTALSFLSPYKLHLYATNLHFSVQFLVYFTVY